MIVTTPPWDVCARLFFSLSVFVLLAAYPLALVLPEWWGHENQPVESTQIALLAFGMVSASMYFRSGNDPARWLGLAAVPIWLVLIGRELSWGAVLIEPSSVTDHGPIFSSRFLWYKPAVAPVVAALILSCIAIVVAKRLAPLAAQLARRRRLPLASLVIVTVGMLASAGAEGHLGFEVTVGGGIALLIEEISELAAYLALIASQFFVFANLGRQETGGG